jgi:ATP-dependent DNA helicase RecG
MTLAEILSQGESETVEFKQSVSEWREIVETVAAFATGPGGHVLVGVRPDGTPVGVEVGKDTLEDLSNKIVQHTDPAVIPSLTVEEHEGHTLLRLQVEESPLQPVWAFGHAFRRSGRSNRRLSMEEALRLYMDSRSLTWDEVTFPEATGADLDEGAVQAFLNRARAVRQWEVDPQTPVPLVLEQLNLVRGERLTAAALLLFGRQPQRFLLQAEVRCGRFKGTEPLQWIDLKVLRGTLFQQVQETMAFIQRHISMSAIARGKGLEREERWEYPLDAVEEAVINALCHRDYADTSNVQVYLFEDRLEVWNPGLLPEGLSVDDLRVLHKSRPRNKLIAQVFFLAGHIERWGTGTLRVIDACRAAGLPDPEFEERAGSFIVRLRKSRLTDEYLQSLGLNERQRQAVAQIQIQREISSGWYQDAFQVSYRTAARDLSGLVEAGILSREGQGKTTVYRLAE